MPGHSGWLAALSEMVLGVFQGFFSVTMHAWTSRLAGLYEMALAMFRDSVVPGRLYLLASLLASYYAPGNSRALNLRAPGLAPSRMTRGASSIKSSRAPVYSLQSIGHQAYAC